MEDPDRSVFGRRRFRAGLGLALVVPTALVALVALFGPSASAVAQKPPADFTGDGRTDFAVYRPSNGAWYVNGGISDFWGISGDVPAPGDYTGDGKADFAVFRPGDGSWWVKNGTNVFWGTTGDVPVPGDYTGDGKADFAVFRPGDASWHVLGGTSAFWGTTGDVPVPGDYTGDGKTDFAVYRPSTGAWYVNGGTAAFWGVSGDIPVPGDYTGDGKTDFAIYRPSTGAWYVNGGTAAFWGTIGDAPIPGDYNGDGKTDFAVYRPSTGAWYVLGGTNAFWGISGDIPAPGALAAVLNDPPVLPGIEVGPLTYTENAPAGPITSTITTFDADSPNLVSATVSITTGFSTGQDVLALASPPAGITPSYDAGTGVLTLSGSASLADYQAALRAVTYANSSDNPSTATRTVVFQVNDGAASNNLSNAASRNITVVAVNDAPVLAGIEGSAITYTENDPATPVTSTMTVADADSANLTGATVSITSNFSTGQDVLSFANQLGITGSYNAGTGVLTLSGTTTVANYQTALRAVRYNNTSENPSGATRTVSFQANDGAGANNLSNTATRNITVIPVNDAPIAANKAHDVTGNVQINTPSGSGLLVGVTDPEGNTFTASVDASNASSGNVVVSADGSYSYNPKPGFEGTDTVKFKVCDNGVPVACTTPKDLTVTISGMIWFVDNNLGATGDGRLTTPFNSLAAFQALNDGVGDHPAPNDSIFIDRNVATDYVGPVTLLNGQKLFGKGATAPIAGAGSLTGITLAADSLALPTTSGIAPRIVTTSGTLNAINLNAAGATGTNTVRGLTIGNTTGAGIAGSGFGTLTSTETAIGPLPRTGAALNLSGGTLSGVTFSDVSSSSSTTAVTLGNIDGNLTISAGTISGYSGTGFLVQTVGGSANITDSGTIGSGAGTAVNISGKDAGTVAFSGAINQSGGGAGVILSSNTGSTISFTGPLTLSTGANNAFNATGGGTVNVADNTSTLLTTTGMALDVENTTIGASGLKFRSISAGTAASGPVSGIVLKTTGSTAGLTVSGTGSANSGGTIQMTTGPGIVLTSTLSPSFAWMNIQNTFDTGIKGTQVVNVSITNSTVNNSGTGHGVDTSNIGFNTTGTGTENNLTGVVTIKNNTLTNAFYQGIDIFNYVGTITSADISDNTLTSGTTTGGGGTSVGSGIRFVAFGSGSGAASITNATINNNMINNFPGAVGLQVQCGNANSAAAPASTCGVPGDPTKMVKITNNKINAPGLGSTVKTGAEGIIALVNGVGQGNFDISSNNVQNNTGTSISSSAFGNAVVTETITNNTVVSNNTVASQGIGIGTSTTGGFATNSPQLTATISGNNVSQTDGNGILAVARDSSNGKLNVSIKNNTVAAPLTGVRPGIRVDAGNSTGDNDVCADISGNTSAASGGTQGIGLRKQGTSPTVNAFGIEGMGATASPGVEAYVNSQNPSGAGTLLISATSGFTNCSTAP